MEHTLTQDLSRALQAFSGIKTIVVTDEYPPETIGGAEISLHEILKMTDEPLAHLVIKFTSSGGKLRYYRQEGINVLALPKTRIGGIDPGQPLGKQKSLFKRYKKRLKHGWKMLKLAVKIMARYGITPERKAAITLELAKKKPAGGAVADCLPEKYDWSARWLNQAIEALKPEHVLANNTRSIMTAYYARLQSPALWQGFAATAIVRDNRFVCVRHNQSMRTRGRDCQTCDLACAREDIRKHRSAHKLLLKASQESRKQALLSADRILVTSQFLYKQIQALVTDHTPIHLVPNFAGQTREIKDHTKTIPEAQKDILALVGSINEAKGQFDFIKASTSYLTENPNAEIHIIGRGDRMKASIEAYLANNPIAGQIKFLGFLDRAGTYQAIQQAKIVILPTLWPEPFGRVPLEAGLCEKPTVAFDTGAFRETILDQTTGFIVPKGDYHAFWQKVNTLLSDPKLRREMGAKAFDHIDRTFSLDTTMAAYRSALASQPAQKAA